MTEPQLWLSHIKPEPIQILDENAYYYHYNITEETVTIVNPDTQEETQETLWKYIQIYIESKPDYRKTIKAVKRKYFSEEEELELLTRYNAFKLGIEHDPSVCEAYELYCIKVTEITDVVKKDFNIQEEPKPTRQLYHTDAAVKILLKEVIKTADLNDMDALTCKAFYPLWKQCIRKTLKENDKVIYEGNLYKVIVPSLLVQTYQPPAEWPDLYTLISEPTDPV